MVCGAMDCFRLRSSSYGGRVAELAMTKWRRRVRQNNTPGKSVGMPENLSSPPRKNISLNPQAKSVASLGLSHPMRGAIAIVTNVRWDAVDAMTSARKLCADERCQRVRRSRVVLTPRCWRQVPGKLTLLGSDGGKRAVHRGDHEVSRKAIAQGRPDALR